MARARSLAMSTHLTLKIWPWVKVMTHPWVMDNNCVKYHLKSSYQWKVIARTLILVIYSLWPWLLRYDLASRSLHTLGCEIWFKSNMAVRSYWQKCWLSVHCDLNLEDMTLGQGHDTPLVHRQQHSNLGYLWKVMVRTRISAIRALWPWPRRYDLELFCCIKSPFNSIIELSNSAL